MGRLYEDANSWSVGGVSITGDVAYYAQLELERGVSNIRHLCRHLSGADLCCCSSISAAAASASFRNRSSCFL